jgi:predicted amidohydrolase
MSADRKHRAAPGEAAVGAVRVGLAQVGSVLGDVDRNLSRAAEVIDEAVAGGADLIVFPELYLSGYAIGETEREVALRADEPRLTGLARGADHRAVVIGFPELDRRGRVYNSVAFFDSGVLAHVHRKLYLPAYGVFEEHQHFSAGAAMRAFDTRFGRMALLICYDAWQPALALLACQDGAEVLLLPANSPHSDPQQLDVRCYWRDITRLYARLFECYVVFVNRAGDERGTRFWGGSHVVDPRGEILCECPEDVESVVVSPPLDPAVVHDRRRELPLTRDPRLALLRTELTRLIDEGGDI